ncbi:centromere protein Q [Mugil cephalus]|uniref:centromere protein Q n=1 Tax=Mugil cephalus TaxID=48193 RepID=UPI001FB72322|nr:centromere protein Q [Mugil cephalus]
MKPVRGSDRAPSKAPKSKHKKKTEEKPGATTTQDQESNGKKIMQRKSAQKRKAEGDSSSLLNKVKVQDNWKPMSRSSIIALENILDLSILATLPLRQTNKKESQEHLNIMKKSFLAQCEQLRVPVQKLKDLEHSSRRHQEETKKSVLAKKTLTKLEEGLKTVGRDLERTEEQNVSLQHSCSILRDQVEEEVDRAEKMLLTTEQAVLSLPPLPAREDETTLEARLSEMIPDGVAEATARKLGKILQQPEADRDDQVLLLQAQKHAARLFSPGSIYNRGALSSAGT